MTCGWPWGPCEDELVGAECSIGETRSSACYNCGVQKDVCDTTTCTWIGGACLGGGPCAPGDVETTPTCHTRTCTDKCTWPDWSPCSDAGADGGPG